ncbi:hypothetical protein LTR08_009120 [Meristemomyces frigidus]|nr:hypothetical protein LTR08_009120 [Meristemomyces frigidus]
MRTNKRPQSSQARLEGRERRKRYVSLIREENEFRWKTCRRLLTTILINFRKADNIPAITATGTELQDGLMPWGHRRLATLLGYAEWAVDLQRDESSAFHVVIRAVLAARYPMQRLEMGNVQQGYWRGAGVPPSLFQRAADSDMDFSALRTLKITLSPERDYHYGREGYAYDKDDFASKVQDMADFFHFLSKASNLTTLSVTIDDHKVPQGLHNFMFRYFAYMEDLGNLVPRLRNLEFVGHQIPLTELLVFVTKRKEVLRSLSLTRVREGGRNYSAENSRMLRHLRGMVQLEMVDSYNGDAWATTYVRHAGRYYNTGDGTSGLPDV